MPRRAILSLMTCVLALVTAVALLRAGAVVSHGPAGDPAAGITRSVVLGFYDAVNDAIRTGDVSALDAVAGRDLVLHAPVPGVPPNRAGLARYLAAVHATFPNARLVIEDVVAVGDRAMARVGVRGTGDGAFLGIPLAGAPAIWGPLDAFRVAGGRVVEHWGSAGVAAQFEPLQRVPISTMLPTDQAITLERLTFPPGGRVEPQVAAESYLIYVEDGTFAVSIERGSREPILFVSDAAGGAGEHPKVVAPGTDVTLSTGDFLAIPRLGRYAMRNNGSRPGTALVTAALTPGALGGSPPSSDPAYPSPHPIGEDGIGRHPLAGGRLTALPPGPVILALGRATLPPGASVAFRQPAGPVLLSVEAGRLGLEAGPDPAWVRRGVTGFGAEMIEGSLTAGDGALVQPGTALVLRNLGDEPAAVLVVTIQPDQV